jgi:hypothetical protein
MSVSSVVPTSFAGVDSYEKEIQVYCWTSSNIGAGRRLRGERVTSCHLIWLLSIKLKKERFSFCCPSLTSKYCFNRSHFSSITSHQPISPSCLVW